MTDDSLRVLPASAPWCVTWMVEASDGPVQPDADWTVTGPDDIRDMGLALIEVAQARADNGLGTRIRVSGATDGEMSLLEAKIHEYGQQAAVDSRLCREQGQWGAVRLIAGRLKGMIMAHMVLTGADDWVGGLTTVGHPIYSYAIRVFEIDLDEIEGVR